MKLKIGENIRAFRKKNDLTQEELAERLGVTYQSVSRWENGTTYPDLELLPSISEVLGVTVDDLLGMPQIEKEKRAEETLDELRRECIKRDYDADKIVNLLRDIRRNYMSSNSIHRPWVEGNDRAFKDPKILPEVRLFAQAYLERYPMNPHVLGTMAKIEDEDHLQDFLNTHTTPFDCSERALMFDRYWRRGDAERLEPERRYKLYQAFNTLLCPRYLLRLGCDADEEMAADRFMKSMLAQIRHDAMDDGPDMWIDDRMGLGLKETAYLAQSGKIEDAITELESVVKLLEQTMKITDEVTLPTSCRFLDGMKWSAKEMWTDVDNNPDSPEERMIYIATRMNGMSTCYCIFPSRYFDTLQGENFVPLHDHPEFEKLVTRVKALIVKRPKIK